MVPFHDVIMNEKNTACLWNITFMSIRCRRSLAAGTPSKCYCDSKDMICILLHQHNFHNNSTDGALVTSTPIIWIFKKSPIISCLIYSCNKQRRFPLSILDIAMAKVIEIRAHGRQEDFHPIKAMPWLMTWRLGTSATMILTYSSRQFKFQHHNGRSYNSF